MPGVAIFFFNRTYTGSIKPRCKLNKCRSLPWNLKGIYREWLEDTLRADLSRVQVRFGPEPSQYGARGFASSEVVMLLPETAENGGRDLTALLAHEFTHIVQQRRIARIGGTMNRGVLYDEELEAEAQELELNAALASFGADVNTLAVLDLATGVLPASFGSLIQCASSGYSVLSDPGAKIEGGLRYFRTDFTDETLKKQAEKLRKSFREAIEHYVRLVRPGEVGVESWEPASAARKKYVDAVYARIKATPYLLKELLGDKKVAFDDLSPADQRWVHDELFRAWDKLRTSAENMQITERICLGHSASWMDFRAVDCVFAAILRTLTQITSARVDTTKVGKGQDPETVVTKSEEKEAQLEAWLAEYFNVARTVTPDVQLIHLLESDLGWKNMSSITKFAELKTAPYRGKSFIVSYERTAGTSTRDAFWHTVYVEISSSGKAAITDRQATGLGSSGAIADSAKCDAWKIDPSTKGFKELKEAFDEKFG